MCLALDGPGVGTIAVGAGSIFQWPCQTMTLMATTGVLGKFVHARVARQSKVLATLVWATCKTKISFIKSIAPAASALALASGRRSKARCSG